jgi:hypothetical protein
MCASYFDRSGGMGLTIQKMCNPFILENTAIERLATSGGLDAFLGWLLN